MIKTLSPYRANNSLRVSVLPRGAKISSHTFDTKCFKVTVKCEAKYAAPVVNNVLEGGIKR
jgi:hypothetical protein